MIIQLPCKCCLWAMDSNYSCHSSFEAIDDRRLLSQDDRAKVHLLAFLIKDLAERPVLLDLGLVLVVISCIC